MLGVTQVTAQVHEQNKALRMDRTTAQKCSALMAKQHGVISRAQAVDLDCSAASIKWQTARGEWVRLMWGVYADASSPKTPLQRLMAVCLAAGAGALATSVSAAWVWGLSVEPAVHQLLVTGGRPRHLAGAVIRRTSFLKPLDLTRRDGIPVTTVDRTIIECARDLEEARLRQVVETALRMRLTYPARVERRLDQLVSQGRRGSGTLREILAEMNDGQLPTESELESAFLRLCRRARLNPIRQLNVRDTAFIGRVDFCFIDERVIVEVDGRASHTIRADFEKDRRRDARLHAQGWTVLRFSWRQVTREPETVLAALRKQLALAQESRWSAQGSASASSLTSRPRE